MDTFGKTSESTNTRPGSSGTDNGIISVKSVRSVKDTADLIEEILSRNGLTVIARINHAAGAQKIGETLRPTELILFANPKAGTPLMQSSQSAAIDLPQKALIWEDEAGQVWFSYNDPRYLAKRHAIKGCDEVIANTEAALDNLAQAAATA